MRVTSIRGVIIIEAGATKVVLELAEAEELANAILAVAKVAT